MLIPRHPPPKSHSPVLKSSIRAPSYEVNPYLLANSPAYLPKMASKQKIPTYQATSVRMDSLPSEFSSVPHGQKPSSYVSSMNMIKDELKVPPSGNGGGTYRGTINSQILAYEQKGYKMLSPMQTNALNNQDTKPSVRKTRVAQPRDTIDSPDVKESMKVSKSQVLKTTALNSLAKNTKAHFERQGHGLVPVDESRLKKLSMSSIKEFSDKYTLKYLQGYSTQLLEKCISLLSTEHDPFIMENMFPGQYAMYISVNPNVSSLDVTKANSKLTSFSINEQFDSLNNPTPSHSNNTGFLPSIRSKRLENMHLDSDSQGPASRSSIYSNSRFSGISVLGSKKYKALPRMDIETFKESLYFYKDFAHKSVLLLIEATYKGAIMQVGFIELLWDENKQGSLCISKYFIQKVYRKMGLMIPATVKVLDHLFKNYKVDRLSIEMLPGNDGLHDPLTLAGFKYEKVFFRNEQKWQNYALKKRDFYQCFHDIVGLPENYTLDTTYRSVPKGMW